MAGWHLVFWEPTVSPHKLALVRALQRHPAVASCRYVADVALSAGRAAQGWALGALDDIALTVAPTAAEIDALAAEASGTILHIVSGLRHQRVIVEALRSIQRRGARFILMSEPRASEGWRGTLRLAQSRATEASLRRNAAGVLAIGRNGPPWFRATGFTPEQIFPFAYFLPAPSEASAAPRQNDIIRLAYLGRLVDPKGIGLLLDAIPLLPPRLRVEIAGHGEQAPRVEAAASESGGRIVFHGPIGMNLVPAFLAGIDILVQPSLTTDDGWAAVVSEALLSGATAIATAKVGASILLDAPERGRVIEKASPEALAGAITEMARNGDFSPAARAARREWALAHLTGEAGAHYLVSILAHLFDGASRPADFYA